MTRIVLLLMAVAGLSLPVQAQTVRPGAPGEASRIDTVRTAPTRITHVEADVRFMRDMIHHHAQAVVMTSLVVPRTENEAVRAIAQRIAISQEDEMAMMRQWLEARGEAVPDPDPHHGHADRAEYVHQRSSNHDHGDHDRADHGHGEPDHEGHDAHAGHEHHDDHTAHAEAHADGHAGMPGMLSHAQLARLAAAQDAAFDRLFLEYMIFHHEGAITMVEDLFTHDGAGQDTSIFGFASHVEADQRAEILRMRRLLSTLSHDH